MRANEILKITAHRPWDLPEKSWSYYQEWNDALFLHWEVEEAELKKLIPGDLELDLFDGKPWISLVAFSMNNIRPRYIPPFAPVSNFHEINIRTYVKKGTKSGVYFLSIEAGNKLACAIARILSKLPYRYSGMKREKNLFKSVNTQFGDDLLIRYRVGNPLTRKIRLVKWLTERYALYHDTRTAINVFEIHHLEWPLYELFLDDLHIRYARFSKLLIEAPLLTHYSSGVKVLAWNYDKELRQTFRR